MEIFPAIDLREGQAVRLSQGDYDKMTVYSKDPLEVAKDFREKGAKNLHVVDLDGAKDGRLSNFETISKILEEPGLFIQVGGGIRDEERIRRYVDLGVNRMILGTIATSDFDFVRRMVGKYGDKIAVGVDVRNGFVAVNGWKEITELKGMEFCGRLRDAGVSTVIYTDISKDGEMQGTNLEAYQSLSELKGLNIVASGGISSLEEIRKLKEMGTYGAILGKSLYEELFRLEDALKVSI